MLFLFVMLLPGIGEAADYGNGSVITNFQDGDTISGNATLSGSVTIPSGAVVTIKIGGMLTVDGSKSLTVEGTLIIEHGCIINNYGTINNNGTIDNNNGTIYSDSAITGVTHSPVLMVLPPVFPVVVVGYTQPEKQRVAIANSSGNSVAISTITLSSTNFTLTGGTANLTVGAIIFQHEIQPMAGLSAGIYSANLVINGNELDDPITFHVCRIDSISAAVPSMTSAGGDNAITINGAFLPAGMTVTAFDGATATTITGTTTGSGLSVTATLPFPRNTSTAADKAYTIKVSLDGGTTYPDNPVAAVTVSKAPSGGGGDPGTPTTPVTGVTLNPTTLSMTTGGTSTLMATVAPSSATNKSVTWKSSDETVATVDANGKITAIGPGTCTITATTADGGKTATCTVTVANVPVTGVTLTPATRTLKKGESFRLTATVAPDNATNKNVTWSSSNTNFATVDANGKVTGVAAGTVVITVKTGDGEKTATCTVTVTETEIIIDLSDLGLENGTLKLEPGQEVDMTIVGTPAGLKFKATGLPDGLTLTEDGRLTGKVPQVGKYSVTLTVTAPDGTEKTASFTVEVTEEEIIVKSDGSSGGCNMAGLGLAIPALGAAMLKRWQKDIQIKKRHEGSL